MELNWVEFKFLFPAGSAITNIDMCSSENVFSDDDDTVSLRVKDIGNITRNCSCNITTNSAFYVRLSDICLQCRLPNFVWNSCLCAGIYMYLTISNTCILFDNRNCTQVSYTKSPCQPSTKFTLTLSMKPWTPCMKSSENLTFIIRPPANSGKCHLTTMLLQLGDRQLIRRINLVNNNN